MKSFFALLLLGSCYQLNAQSVLKKAGEKTSQHIDTRVDQGIEKGLNNAEQAIGNIFKKKANKIKEGTHAKGGSSSGVRTHTPQAGTGKTRAGNSDFIPGEAVIFEDKFEKDAIADFPARWNTNGSGKLVTIEGVEGKWLEVAHNATVNPVMNKALPENCTIEFDLFLQSIEEMRTPIIIFGLTPVRDILKEDLFYGDKFYINLSGYNHRPTSNVEYGLKYAIGNRNDFNLIASNNKVLHVSMSVNKTRIRVYLNQSKVVDLPRAITPEMRRNFFITNGYVIPASEIGVFVSNIRIASAQTDARSVLIKQFMEEGTVVTNDILFDVNSDVIKPASYPVINQFGEAMKANPSLRIKITGHTDSNGSASGNLVLSQKRAASVKKYLQKQYGIDTARISTDGKGASVPVAPNTSVEGKAKNRRVEFTRL